MKLGTLRQGDGTSQQVHLLDETVSDVVYAKRELGRQNIIKSSIFVR